MQKRYTEADIQNASRQTDMQVEKGVGQNCYLSAGKETKMRAGRHEDLDSDKVQADTEWMRKLCLQADKQTHSHVGGENDRQTD